MICAACGTENRPGSRFCDHCGAPLAVTCPSCGEANRSDARFCASCGGPMTVDGTAQPPASAERRLVSVLFADLVGFTSLAEDRDPESVRDLLSRYFDVATEIVTLHGGTVEKFIGDAVMAVWGTPVAHEDDAERAVRAALELVDAVAALSPDLRARAGVLTGEAAVTLGATNQGMVAGDLVNTAARLQGVAAAGTVLVGESTMRAAERAIVFEPIGDHSLKGKTSPVPAWQALRVVAQRGGQGRTDTLEPPFVGRDEELRQLKDVLHAVGREKRPRLVSITGPGGIGKSRLVWELEKYVDGVAELIYWHRGRSPSYGEGITFWALGEMVRRRARLTEDDDESATRNGIAAMLDEYVRDAGERERIGPAVLSLLGVEDAPAGGRDALFPAWRLLFERIAEKGTTVLVFEDLQWADTGLLDFIDHLLDWSRGLPIMVVTLARPELFDKRPDWGAGRRHLTALALEPLTDAAVRDLLNGLVPGLPDDALAAIVGRAEGVPLYAVETVRGLLASGRIERRGDVYEPVGDLSTISVPDSLRSLIASRLDALDPADRGLLQDAAVLGQVFSTATLAAVTGGGDVEERLRRLVRRELLDVERDPASPERGQYKFVQSLIREVAYGTLGRRDRRARHLAVARHFETLGDDELAGALATHYLAARAASDDGPEADALATQARLALVGAAQRATELGSPQQAVRYLDQALQLATAPEDRADLLERAATNAARAAVAGAEEYATAAVEARRELGDAEAVIRASTLLGHVLTEQGDTVRSRDLLESVAAEADEERFPAAAAACYAELSRAYMRRAQYDESITAADRALSIAENLNLEDVAAEAFADKGAALAFNGRRREAAALLKLAVAMATEHGRADLETRARHNLANILGDDDPIGAMEELRTALRIGRERGDRSNYAFAVASVTASVIWTGEDWDEQIANHRELLADPTLHGGDRARLRALMGGVESRRGENFEAFLGDVDEIVGDDPQPDMQFLKRMARMNVAFFSGRFEAAYDFAMEAAALPTQVPDIALLFAVAAAAALRDPVRARAAADPLLALPGSGAFSRAANAASQGVVDALEGRPEEALRNFRYTRQEMGRLGQWYASAEAALNAMMVMPEHPEIRAWAAEAREIFERTRSRPALARLDAALSAGAPERGTAVTEPTGAPAEAAS